MFMDNGANDDSPRIRIDRKIYNQPAFEHEFEYSDEHESLCDATKRKWNEKISCNRQKAQKTLFQFLPILKWLLPYVKRNFLKTFPHDLTAGLTVGIMQIPQGMAYAALAGVDPVYGLYTSFFPSLIYVFLGTSRHISMGTFAVASLMIATVRYDYVNGDDQQPSIVQNHSENISSNSSNLTPIEVVTSLTLLIGLIQIVMGILHLGFLSVYLSDQVVSGFTTAAAVMVFTSQVNEVFGLPKSLRSGPGKLLFVYKDLIGDLHKTNLATFTISVLSIIVIYLVKDCINNRYKKQLIMPIPIDLIVIIVSTICSYFAKFDVGFNVQIVNHIPRGLPTPEIPRFDIMPGMLGHAFSIAIVIFSISISMAKIFAKKHNYNVDANQLSVLMLSSSLKELYAYGIINSVTSTVGCIAATGSLARSSVNEASGAKSQISGVISSLVVLIVILFLGPFLESLPKCVLAAIIIVALKGMFMQFGELKTLWKASKIDFLIWIVSFGATFILDVTYGLAVSLAFALMTLVVRTQMASGILVGKIPRTEFYKELSYKAAELPVKIVVFKFSAPLNFANAELFRERLYKRCGIDLPAVVEVREQMQPTIGQSHHDPNERKNAPDTHLDDEDVSTLVQTYSTYPMQSDDAVQRETFDQLQDLAQFHLPDGIIFDASDFNYIDTMGIQSLKQIYVEMREINVKVMLAACNRSILDMLNASEVYKTIPRDSIYVTVEDAMIMMKQGIDE